MRTNTSEESAASIFEVTDLNFIFLASTQHDTNFLRARRFIDYGEVFVCLAYTELHLKE
jgi:hypothetical protein